MNASVSTLTRCDYLYRENVQFYGSFIETPCIWKTGWESDGKNSDNEKLGSCQRHPSSFCREIKKGAFRLDQLNKTGEIIKRSTHVKWKNIHWIINISIQFAFLLCIVIHTCWIRNNSAIYRSFNSQIYQRKIYLFNHQNLREKWI